MQPIIPNWKIDLIATAKIDVTGVQICNKQISLRLSPLANLEDHG